MGPFRVESAVDIETLRQAFDDGTWGNLVLPVDSVLFDWHAAILGEANAGAVSHGQTLSLVPPDEARLRALAAGTPCRAYSLDGRLVALLEYAGDVSWKPTKVVEAPYEAERT